MYCNAITYVISLTVNNKANVHPYIYHLKFLSVSFPNCNIYGNQI